jgi:hypothetical protein
MLAAAKPFASLSSGLLARKGQARPAMRRQATLAEAGDDLGWNDMGEPVEVAAPAPLPPVLAQREELAETFAAPERPVAPVTLAPLGKRAAFTLRLDADRHLRLRLASATRGQSAQKLVTEALDAFLTTMPDVAALAESVAAKADH